MKNRKFLLHKLGFSVIELLLLISLIGFMAIMTSGYLFGSLEKYRLTAQRDKIVEELKQAQQNSRIARGSKEYGLHFSQDHITTAPDNRQIFFEHGVQLKSFDSPSVFFEKLSGNLKVNNTTHSLELVFVSHSLSTSIKVNAYGVIEVTNPKSEE